MSDERTEEFSEPRLNIRLAVSDDKRATDTERRDTPATQQESQRDKGNGTKEKADSMAKVRLQSRLPALEDDADIGVEKDHIVTRDGKADLLFTGSLLAVRRRRPRLPRGNGRSIGSTRRMPGNTYFRR